MVSPNILPGAGGDRRSFNHEYVGKGPPKRKQEGSAANFARSLETLTYRQENDGVGKNWMAVVAENLVVVVVNQWGHRRRSQRLTRSTNSTFFS